MHRLHLLRHAKSSWAQPGVDDHDRPLAPRGVAAAASLAGHFGAVGLAPGLVLCSSARRALETLAGVQPGLPADLTVRVEEGLYGASAGALLRRVRAVPGDTASVLLIGHNPGCEDLARGLAGTGDPHLRARLAAKFPTGGLATLAFPGPWRDLDRGGARLEAFVVPRDLPASR